MPEGRFAGLKTALWVGGAVGALGLGLLLGGLLRPAPEAEKTVERPLAATPEAMPPVMGEEAALEPSVAPPIVQPPLELPSLSQGPIAAPAEIERPQPVPDALKPAWRRFAAAVPPDAAGRPQIAVVLDDFGLNRRNAARAIDLPAPLTLAFMTYADHLEEMTGRAHTAGHELMLHVPMEPMNGDLDTGPNALKVSLPPEELRRRIVWGLERTGGYVGINNHMGSRFTADRAGMQTVMDEVKARGLLFLDSRTTPDSVGEQVAAESGVPYAGRDVFLDNELDRAAIDAQLAETEAIARHKGSAIAIGHPHGVTLDALADWLPHLAERGFVLVPVSAIVEQRRQIAHREAASGPPS